MMEKGPNEAERDLSSPDRVSENSTEYDEVNSRGGFAEFARIFSYADSRGWALNMTALVCSIGAGTALPLMTIVFGSFVTAFNNFALGELEPDVFRHKINTFTLYFIYIFAGKLVLTYIFTLAATISATRTTKALRIDFLERTLRQETAFFDRPSNGAVAVQVTTSANLVNQGIGERLGIAIQAIATFFSAFIVALAVQWKLALIVMCIVPLLVIVTGVTVWIDAEQEAKILEQYSMAGSMAEEVFNSIGTVHAFWAHSRLSEKFDKFLQAAEKLGMKKSPNLGVLYCVEYFCVFGAYALAFWQGIRMYSSGEIEDVGTVVTVEFAIVMAATSINFLAPQLTIISKAASAASELFRIIDKPSLIDPLSEDGVKPEKLTGQIEICDVSFAYPSRQSVNVLKNLTLSVPANKTTALVGPSGCGKSTIIGLLEHWYEPLDGKIFLDGIELRDLNLQWLRTNVRLVQQLPTLFNGTVFKNVTNGLVGTQDSGISEERQMTLVEEACKIANAHEFIVQLPHGYHTEVGERGTMLSGGQKQRIAIARSIISDPKILLLDEATSALDARAERLVQDALDKVSKSRTTIVIAHKLATVKNADNIAVMSNGSIVEQGTHEELIIAGGTYARMVEAQDLGQPDEIRTFSSDDALLDNTVSRVVTKVISGQPTIDIQSTASQTMNYGLIKCLWIMIREQRTLRLWFAILFLGCVIVGLTFPAQAIVFARAIRVFQLEGDDRTRERDFFALMFFVIALVNLVAYFIIGWVSNIVAQVGTRSYRFEMFDTMLHQDMAFFDRPENTAGALTSHLSTKPTSLQELFGFNLIIITATVVNLTGSCILALIIGWKLALAVIFGGLPPLVLSGYIRIRMETKLEDHISDKFSQSAGLAGEAVAAIRTVSSLALERHILARYRDSLSFIVQKSISKLLWTMLWFALSQSIEFLAMALGFWYGGQLLSTGEYSTSQFYTVFTAVIFSGQAAAYFFSFTTSITKATGSANYILWLRNQKPAIQENEDNKDNEPTGDGTLSLCSTTFSYPQRPNSQVIKGITLTIEQGQFIAFVGPSGCGKSTLIALLERFYDPSTGQITLSNTDLRKLPPRLYRQTIGLVQQEPILYRGTIRENIALGFPNQTATDEQITEACVQANILTFIDSLPDGMDTLCGTQGLQLSGGQRQRITIARALIRNPKLLLLDEATSALDTESEKVVQAALEKASRGDGGNGRTTVAVAHRLSTIRDADVIFALGEGRVLETGTHDELVAKRGVYYGMCLAQSLDRVV